GGVRQYADVYGENDAGLHIVGSGNTTFLNGNTTLPGSVTYSDTVVVNGAVTLNVGGDVTVTSAGRIQGGGGSGGHSLTVSANGSIQVHGDIGGERLTGVVLSAIQIVVHEHAVISTRDILGTDLVNGVSVGDSGLLKLEAPGIELRAGSKLLADATGSGGFASGDVLLLAENIVNNILIRAGGAITQVGIELAEVEIRGRNVEILAEAGDRNLVGGLPDFIEDQVLTRLANLLQDNFQIPMMVMIKRSAAEITVSGSSQIVAGGRLTILANAVSDATAKAVSNLFSFGFSHAYTRATVEIGS
ncbi:hypothetical protein, partial [Limnospira sp. Paracas R14]|uniref:hypothetical protein n=1 Tax=Limnospira sp. Paracas R14 TaxID=2981108 RepID=UPI0028E0C308|nr:hypothetical protein [Limnospira sp. Paracas R14]